MKYRVPFSDVLHSGRQQWCAGLDHFEYILDIGAVVQILKKEPNRVRVSTQA